MAGEAVGAYDGKTDGQFTSLMAAAAETQSEAARKLARLQTLQKSESVRLREREVAAKEHEKQERWNNAAPVQKPANPEQPKKPTPQRTMAGMSFKKLLKEASKVDSSTFKVGPKVKLQARPAEKPRSAEKPRESTTPPVKRTQKQPLPPQPVALKPGSSRPRKASVERSIPSTSRSISPRPNVKKLPTHPKSNSSKLTVKSTGPDPKSHLRDSYVPFSQGPKRDLRTTKQIQTDLRREKGKDYPKEKSRVPPTTQTPEPIKRKRRRESSESQDSFVVSSDDAEKPEQFDYRAEIRAMFKRKGPEPVDISDDDSDMEASGFEMAREEARAAKLARLEDEEEIRREEDRIKDKKRRKIEAERKKVKSGK